MSAGYGDGVLACLQTEFSREHQLAFLRSLVQTGGIALLREVLPGNQEVVELRHHQGQVTVTTLSDCADILEEDPRRSGSLSYDDWCSILRDDFELALPSYQGPSRIDIALDSHLSRTFYPISLEALKGRLQEGVEERNPQQQSTIRHLLEAVELCRKRGLAFSVGA